MLIYQWSAMPRADCWEQARDLVHEFTRFGAASLDWPRGVVLVSDPSHGPRGLRVEYPFEDAPEFEAAWQRLSDDAEAARLWLLLCPLFEDSSIRREVFDVQYSRAGAAER